MQAAMRRLEPFKCHTNPPAHLSRPPKASKEQAANRRTAPEHLLQVLEHILLRPRPLQQRQGHQQRVERGGQVHASVCGSRRGRMGVGRMGMHVQTEP